jgi:hypothetical protein
MHDRLAAQGVAALQLAPAAPYVPQIFDAERQMRP